MTVIEKAEIPVKDGSFAEFEAVLPQALPILRAAAGCRGVRIGKGVENPESYLLTVEWDSVEAHTEFTTTPEFGQFVGLVKDFFAGPPGATHFSTLHEL